MRVWIDLSNSPHVALFEPVVRALRERGDEVIITARDHAQTAELARTRWPEVIVTGGESPSRLGSKGGTIIKRAEALRRLARHNRPDVALSHGSYAQLLAAKAARVPAVTMMDYEHQPANHLSFRLARRVVVPDVFPVEKLRRCGAAGKVARYEGFKEELYLADFRVNDAILAELGLDSDKLILVMRPPPDGALYHRGFNGRFEQLLATACERADVQPVLLPRGREQVERYRTWAGVLVPDAPVDGRSLLACADLTIGAGGTMNRESALLGTPTYTVFIGLVGAVDSELMRRGLLHDLRAAETEPEFVKKAGEPNTTSKVRARAILELVTTTLDELAA